MSRLWEKGLPLDERVREMSKLETKAAILKDADVPVDEAGAMANVHGLLKRVAPFMFPITTPIDYEPEPQKMLGALIDLFRR